MVSAIYRVLTAWRFHGEVVRINLGVPGVLRLVVCSFLFLPFFILSIFFVVYLIYLNLDWSCLSGLGYRGYIHQGTPTN